MKVAKHSNSLETNVECESKSFGIGDASVVIDILRNRLYENKIQTLVQEYICNARDAMREVGKGCDFEVTMPTRLQPTFKVRDFGPGISPERMEKVFILYGASTKRGSNNQTGGFGIGAKSAWSYTDSFTVTSVVDGIRRAYVCHTGLNNQGSLDLVSEDKTDQPNGTEIQIAVKHHDLNEFKSAIFRAIYFWAERPKVSGEELPTLTPGYMVNSNVETIDRNSLPEFIGMSYYDKALAVIDGVAYPIREKLLQKVKALSGLTSRINKTLILHFGNGLVGVSASRESIDDSDLTIQALNKMANAASLAIDNHIKAEFAKVKSTSEHFATYKALSPYFSVDKFSKFGDYSIQQGELVSADMPKIKMTIAHTLDKRKRHRVERLTRDEVKDADKSIPIDALDRVFLITKTENTVTQNKRLRAFFTGKPAEKSSAILLEYSGDPAVVDKLVKDLGIKAFETLEYTEVPRAAKVKIEREKQEFCMHSFTSYGRHQYTSLEKNTKQYLYVLIGTDGSWEGFSQGDLRDLNYYLKENESLEIVGLADKAYKMVNGDKNFTPLKEWLAKYSPSVAEVNFAIANQAKNGNVMEAVVGLQGIKDTFLADMAKEYKAILAGKRKIREIPGLLQLKVKEAPLPKAFFDNDAKLTKLIDEKYPLVRDVSRYSDSFKELTFYINAKYDG